MANCLLAHSSVSEEEGGEWLTERPAGSGKGRGMIQRWKFCRKGGGGGGYGDAQRGVTGVSRVVEESSAERSETGQGQTAWETECWGHGGSSCSAGLLARWSSWGQASDPQPHTCVMFFTEPHTLEVTSWIALGVWGFLGRRYGKTREKEAHR